MQPLSYDEDSTGRIVVSSDDETRGDFITYVGTKDFNEQDVLYLLWAISVLKIFLGHTFSILPEDKVSSC